MTERWTEGITALIEISSSNKCSRFTSKRESCRTETSKTHGLSRASQSAEILPSARWLCTDAGIHPAVIRPPTKIWLLANPQLLVQ